MTDSFPRQQARTRRFTLGAPRSFSISPSGDRVFFLRSPTGDDPSTCLWMVDAATGEESKLVDPSDLLTDTGDEQLPAAERARRERAREGAGGIVAFETGGEGASAISFALAGRPYHLDVDAGHVVENSGVSGAFDVRVNPSGALVAYVLGGALRVWEPGTGRDSLVIGEDDPDISWGSAEFVAGEEMGRTRGYWWSPDGQSLLVSRVDVSPVQTWYLADPTDPVAEPRKIRYPAAGTANAGVELAIFGLNGDRVDVDWAGERWEYLANAIWSDADGLHLVVQTRDQRELAILAVDLTSGSVEVVHEETDETWVELVPGSPAWSDRRMLSVAERGRTRQLCVDGEPVSGPDLWVRKLVGPYLGGVVFIASGEPTEAHVFRWTSAGVEQLTSEPGMHDAHVGGSTMVVTSSFFDRSERSFEVRSGAAAHRLADHSEPPAIDPAAKLICAGPLAIRTAVLFPTDDPGGALPVLLDPYGGPHAQRVVASRGAYAAPQWFADQGFAVIVADGRGTPARGDGWERSVRGDLASMTLEDQIAALDAVDREFPGRLDRSKVAIRGWSFGGYLAGLAVLRRPDIFAAAIAGAPVTDWRLYDTYYTERYLGHPDDEPENYLRSSLLSMAPDLERPLMLIHGLADDNVVSAHTLQLSRELMIHGRPHEVLPLAGVSHMTPQEDVAENLLLLQVEFLRRSLRL